MKAIQFIKSSILSLFILLIYLNCMPVMAQDEKEDAQVYLSFSEEEDAKFITAKATTITGEPIEDLELYFFVKRTFSLLPFGDFFNATDANGEVTVEFPKNLPGDVNGNVTIHVKILESDEYNDLEVLSSKVWGVPIEILDQEDEKRSLWAAAANAPISLIVIVTLMIFAVWYVIFFILFKLYRISRVKETTA